MPRTEGPSLELGGESAVTLPARTIVPGRHDYQLGAVFSDGGWAHSHAGDYFDRLGLVEMSYRPRNCAYSAPPAVAAAASQPAGGGAPGRTRTCDRLLRRQLL